MDIWKVNYGEPTRCGQLTLSQSEDGFYTAKLNDEVLYIGQSLSDAVDSSECIRRMLKKR